MYRNRKKARIETRRWKHAEDEVVPVVRDATVVEPVTWIASNYEHGYNLHPPRWSCVIYLSCVRCLLQIHSCTIVHPRTVAHDLHPPYWLCIDLIITAVPPSGYCLCPLMFYLSSINKPDIQPRYRKFYKIARQTGCTTRNRHIAALNNAVVLMTRKPGSNWPTTPDVVLLHVPEYLWNSFEKYISLSRGASLTYIDTTSFK